MTCAAKPNTLCLGKVGKTALWELNANYVQCPLWVISGHGACFRDVRFTPKSGHQAVRLRCPLCAKSGLMQCSKYTSLFDHLVGAAKQRQGNREASVLAVFRLIANSTLVDCTTGNSAGFSPFKIRPVYVPASR